MLTVEEIKRFIEEDAASGRKRGAVTGERYYNAEHDIRDYRLFYFDANGDLKEDKYRSNIRIAHPFFTEIVDQKVQYILSSDEPFAKSDDQKLQEKLNEYFDDRFYEEFTDALTYASVHGWSYLYAYKGEDGRTRFMFADALGVTEVSGKRTPDGKPYVIYKYTEIVGSKGEKITRVQVWNDEEVFFLISREDEHGVSQLKPDDAYPINPRPHTLYTVEQDGVQVPYGGRNYAEIPFYRIDNNRKRTSDLVPIKALIDDYDLMACGLSNNLQDIQEGIYVVKGFEGDNLTELMQNIKTKKVVGVTEGGGIDIKTIDIPYEARKVKLELDEKNIYRFGMAFNAAQVGDGNVTNVVIKSRYALLDLKCNKAEAKFRGVIQRILQLVLDEINEMEDTAYSMKDVKVEFKRTTIANETDAATIEKTEAETVFARVNALMGALPVLGNKVTAQEVCKALGLEYDKIKDDLPEDVYDLNAASRTLEEMQAGETA